MVSVRCIVRSKAGPYDPRDGDVARQIAGGTDAPVENAVMKAFLIGLGIFLIVLVAAVLVVPGLLDWNDYRGWAAARLGAWTGSSVAIHGDFSVRTLPAPALVAEDVHLASLPGAAHDNLVTVGTLRMSVPWLPLLGGVIEVERLTLVEPRLIMERRTGAGFGLPSLLVPEDSGGAVRLADMRIENGTLILHDPASEAGDLRLDRIYAEIVAESLSGPFAATAEFGAADIPMQLSVRGGRLSPAGALPLNLRLGIDGVEGTLRFAGLLDAGGGGQGDLSLEGFDPAAALAPHVPETVPPALLLALDGQRLNGRSNLAFDAERLSLTDLSLDVGETRAVGVLTWRFGAPPALEADLAVNRIDFDEDWAEAREPLADGLAGLMTAPGAGLTGPGSPTARLAIDIDAVRINQGLVRNFRLRAGWADQLLTLERASAELPGGSAAALAGSLARGSAQPELDVRIQATSSDLRGIIAWLGGDVREVPPGKLRRATATARFSGTRDAFQVTGIDVTVDNTRARGGLAVLDRAVPGIGLRIDVDDFDLDAYLPEPADNTALPVLGHMAGRLPAWSQAVNANLDAAFGRLVVDNIEIADLDVMATLRNGRLDLHEVAAGSVDGASVAVSGAIATLDPLAGLDLSVDLAVPDAAPFFRLLDGEVPVSAGWLDRLAAEGRIAYDERIMRVDLVGEAAGGAYEVSGSVTRSGADPAFDLTARIRHDDLMALLAPLAGRYRPAEPLGGLDLYAEIAGPADNLTFRDLQGQVGPVSLAGDVTVDRRGARPHVEAALQAGRIALDRLLPAEPAWAAGRSPGAWSRRAVDVALLNRLDGRLALTAMSLSRGAFTIDEPALRVELADGTLTLTGLTGRLFDGTFGLSGRLEADPTVRATGALDLVGAAAAPALAAAGVGEAFAGTLNFGFDGATEGETPAAMIAGLAGEGVLSVRDGALYGPDLPRVARIIAESDSAASALLALPEALTTGTTPFATLNAPFSVEAGVGTAAGYRLVGQYGVAIGDATVDLRDWLIDAGIRFGLARLPDAPSILIRLEGPLNAPRVSFGIEALQRYIQARYAEARAE